MNGEFSKTNDEFESISARLREVRMTEHDRLIAQAHLMRAQAISNLLVALGRGLKALALALLRPLQRLGAQIQKSA